MDTDPVAAIRTLLLADTTLDGLVDGRVGWEIPDSDDKQMSRACVIVKPAGGPRDVGTLDVGDVRIDTLCYGVNSKEAYAVWRAVHGALKPVSREIIGDCLIHTVTPLTKGFGGIDPDTEWPVCIGSFNVRCSETTIS